MDSTGRLVVFRLEGRSYGLWLSQVERVVRSVDCTPLPHAPGVVLGVIDMHGRILPVLNTRGRFGLAERDIGLDDQFIIARAGTRTVALAVDGVIEVVERGTNEIVATDHVVSGVDGIDGVARLDDGLMLIHDLNRFLSLEEETRLDRALTEQAQHG